MLLKVFMKCSSLRARFSLFIIFIRIRQVVKYCIREYTCRVVGAAIFPALVSKIQGCYYFFYSEIQISTIFITKTEKKPFVSQPKSVLSLFLCRSEQLLERWNSTLPWLKDLNRLWISVHMATGSSHRNWSVECWTNECTVSNPPPLQTGVLTLNLEKIFARSPPIPDTNCTIQWSLIEIYNALHMRLMMDCIPI